MSSLDDIRRLVRIALAPVARRTRTLIARGVLELIDDGKKLQAVQVSTRADNLHDDVEHFQPHGFTSVPAVGAECIVVHVGGNSDHPVVIAVDDRRYRPKDLAEGEACMWTIADGKRVLCKADGTVILGTDATEFVALANLVKQELDKINLWITAVHNVINGTTINTLAVGVPDALQAALVTASALLLPVITTPAATEVKAK